MSNIKEVHAAARNWADRTAPALRGSLSSKGLIDTGDLVRSLQPRTAIESERAQIVSVGFRFNRYGVFVAKGARRGHGGKKGSTWRDASGKLRRTNPASLNKLQAKVDWFNPIIKRERVKLEDALGEVFIVDLRRALI